MCGVCGVIGNLRQVNTVAMMNALRHRGPDGEGEFKKQCVWFGHTRLAIIELSDAGKQPMSSERVSVTFNGEIYNFKDIRRTLTLSGIQFKTNSDTEVILRAWECWGEACVREFRGMFAFAVYDHKTGTVSLVRDRMGEKPLYYIQQRDRILFASEVRAILASDVVSRRMDKDGLESYLTFGSVAEPYTLIEGVRSVPSGTIVRFDRKLRKSKLVYWSLSDVKTSTEHHNRNEILQHVRSEYQEACRLCLVSDVPVAVLLSGGIDSSSNVAVLAEQGLKVNTFSLTFGGADAEVDEERWSTLVSNHFETNHCKVEISVEQARSWVPDAIASMDQPSLDGVNTYLVCRGISQSGIKVAITGQGADELFLGYPQRHSFAWLKRIPRVRWASILSRLFSADARWQKLIELVSRTDIVASSYLVQHSLFSQRRLNSLLKGVRLDQTRFISSHTGGSPLDELSRLQISNYLRNTLLRDSDQMSMANSIEMRAPFVDHRLVETITAIDPERRIHPNSRQKAPLGRCCWHSSRSRFRIEKSRGSHYRIRDGCEKVFKSPTSLTLTSVYVQMQLSRLKQISTQVRHSGPVSGHYRFLRLG